MDVIDEKSARAWVAHWLRPQPGTEYLCSAESVARRFRRAAIERRLLARQVQDREPGRAADFIAAAEVLEQAAEGRG
jgi:hypothetical protein